MFTGIIEEVGKLTKKIKLASGLQLSIEANSLVSEMKLGDSIAINGSCSTVTKFSGNVFTVQLSEETLKKTTFSDIRDGASVNLELSLMPQSRLGGHFVTGHVDCVAKIKKIGISKDWAVITINYPKNFAYLLVEKGSVTIEGISLTVVDLTDSEFSCHVIPHTLSNTTLLSKKAGSAINLEFDVLGKYLHRFYTTPTSDNKEAGNLKNSLYKAGFIK